MTTRRNLLSSVVSVGVISALAGCSSLQGESIRQETDANSESTQTESDSEYTYITGVTETVIGTDNTIKTALQLDLTEFATSKHSAGEQINVLFRKNPDSVTNTTLSKSPVPNNSQSLVIPVQDLSRVSAVVVVNDEQEILESTNYTA